MRPHRTPGGRLTFTTSSETADEFDRADLPRDIWFGLRTLAVAAVIIGITLWAFHHWPNQYVEVPGQARKKLPNFHVAYFLYGSIVFFWLILPSISGFGGKEPEYPSLFRTIDNLEQEIGKDRPSEFWNRVGKSAAWLVSFLLLWGMVFLMLHLTLYPFPNITHILNHSG